DQEALQGALEAAEQERDALRAAVGERSAAGEGLADAHAEVMRFGASRSQASDGVVSVQTTDHLALQTEVERLGVALAGLTAEKAALETALAEAQERLQAKAV